jgi:hypothetical protein
MTGGYRELEEAVFGNTILPLLDDPAPVREFPDPVLRRNLPGARSARQALVRRIPQKSSA